MPATSARNVPCSALASGFNALNTSVSPDFSTLTVCPKLRDSVPRGPMTDISPAPMVTSTLGGTLTGLLPMRDMSYSPSGHDAEHFAADTGGARLAIGHDTVRRRDDGDAQPVHHARNVILVLVDPQSRLGDAFDLLDHRPARVVLECDVEYRLDAFADHGEAVDVAFVLEDLGNCHLDLGRRHLDSCLLRQLRIANARQHVGDWITHAHLVTSPARGYQLALTTPGISPRIAISRSLLRPRPNLRNTPRGRPVSLHRLRSLVGLESRGSCCSFCRAAKRASSEIFTLSMTVWSSARFFANFFTILRRFRSRLMTAVLAIASSVQFLNGNLNAASSALASASVFAVVAIVMFMPRSVSILSYSISGKMICSLTPMLKLPRPSNERADTPRKSRTRGSAIDTSRSRNSYMRSWRSVTMQPSG